MSFLKRLFGQSEPEPQKPLVGISGKPLPTPSQTPPPASALNKSSVVPENPNYKDIERGDLHACLEIYRAALPGSEREKLAKAKIIKLAATFGELSDVFTTVTNDDSLRSRTFEQMLRKAHTLEEWEIVHREASRDSNFAKFKDHATAEMKKVAKVASISELVACYNKDDQSLQEMVSAEILERTGGRDDLLQACDELDEGALRELLLKKILAETATIDQYAELLEEIDSAGFKEALEASMETRQFGLDDCLVFLKKDDGESPITDILFRKIFQVIQTPDDFIKVQDVLSEYADENDDHERFNSLLQEKTEWSKEDWDRISINEVEGGRSGLIVHNIAQKKVAMLTLDPCKLAAQYEKYLADCSDDSEDPDDDVLRLIAEQIFKDIPPKTITLIKILLNIASDEYSQIGTLIDERVASLQRKEAVSPQT